MNKKKNRNKKKEKYNSYEPFEKKIQRIEKDSMDLLYIISDGSKTDMDAWSGTELFQFFTALWSRDDELHKQLERIKSHKK